MLLSNFAEAVMKSMLVFGLLAALCLLGSPASAQVNLTGRYLCVQVCQNGLVGAPAFVTQNGWDLNLLSESGVAARAWRDWFSPNRIWIGQWNEGAVFSPDGLTIQFDNGTIWQRDLGLRPPRRR